MAIIQINGFSGENRALHPKALPNGVGVLSRNQKPGRGDLRPWRNPLKVATVPAGQKTIYRMNRDEAGDENYWLSWSGRVHAVRGFNTDDTTEQTYYSGDGAPKVTNNVIGLAGAPYPTSCRPLSVPAPTGAPTISAITKPTVVNPDIGKHAYTLDAAFISGCVVGDTLKFEFSNGVSKTITLTGNSASSIATQISALTQVSATVTNGTIYVVVKDGSGASFKIHKKTGVSESYADADVTYESSYWASGTFVSPLAGTLTYPIVTNGANQYYDPNSGYYSYDELGNINYIGGMVDATPTKVYWGHNFITATNMPVGQRVHVTLNGTNQSYTVTISAQAGTSPQVVTAASLVNSFSSVPGLKATKVLAADGVNYDFQLETVAKGANTSIDIHLIKPKISDVFDFVAQSYEVIASTTVVSKVDYYYVYTFVNDWGWESAPSPVSAVLSSKADDIREISGFSSAPSGNYGIDRIRIYRTQSATSGATDFYFLRDVAYGTSKTQDDNRTLGEALPTTNWLAPPNDLKHLTSLWNGMLAGISGNSIRFCEAYIPYAWPLDYEIIPPDSKPVALGKFGQTMLVLTTGRPLVVSGSSPEAMDQAPLEMYQACVSAESVVSMGNGVAWASEDGLCWYGGSGPRILTAGLMLREDWQTMNPKTIVGQMYEGLYLGSYDDGSGRKGFLIDPNNPTGIYFLDRGYEAMHFDELQDQLYVFESTFVKRWDASTTFMTSRFRSKVFGGPRPVNFGAAEVVADTYPVTVRFDAVNMDATEVTKIKALNRNLTSPTSTSLRYTKTVNDRRPFRLPSGFSAHDWQIEIEGSSPVQYVNMASTITELSKV